MATAVAAEGDPSRLFALVTEEVARLLDAETAALVRFDGDRVIAVGAFNKAGVRGVPVGTEMPLRADTAAGRVFRTGAPARIENYTRSTASSPVSCTGSDSSSSVAAPVFLGGRLWGAMVILSVDRQPFPEDAEQRIALFAELAAQALANAQAREELNASRARIVQAGDEERRRLERNLHDGAQQRLVSLALMLRLAARRHPDDEDLTRAGEELSHALQELRELARGIHPAVLTERGLEPALRALADRAPVPVELDFTPTSRLPGPVEAAAYYVVSEALTNVAKYAGASLVQVRVAQNGSAARDRGRRRRRRRRRSARGLRPARPVRPRRGARRPPDRREPARRGNDPPRRAPNLKRDCPYSATSVAYGTVPVKRQMSRFGV